MDKTVKFLVSLAILIIAIVFSIAFYDTINPDISVQWFDWIFPRPR